MNRRNVLKSLIAGVLGAAGLAAVSAPVVGAQPTLGSTILAVSVFSGGPGPVSNVDTGLRYNGSKVSPNFVSIEAIGSGIKGATGYFPHQADTNIDVDAPTGVNWTGMAFLVQ